MKRWLFVLGLLLAIAGAGGSLGGELPDPARTPGLTNPDVTQQNIKDTICKPGWTKTIRPPLKYLDDLKMKQIAEYGYADKNPAHYEEDQLISLQLGGHPLDPKNLWPQSNQLPCGARVKDALEAKLKRLVCAGHVPLEIAQKAIAANWIEAFKKYVDPKGCPES
jgi:hypothetical protein